MQLVANTSHKDNIKSLYLYKFSLPQLAVVALCYHMGLATLTLNQNHCNKIYEK